MRRDKRTKARGPSLVPTQRPGETRKAFEDAVTRSPTEPTNLLAAFARATQQRRAREKTDDKAPALDHMTRPARGREQPTSPIERGPDPGRERD